MLAHEQINPKTGPHLQSHLFGRYDSHLKFYVHNKQYKYVLEPHSPTWHVSVVWSVSVLR